MHVKIQTFKTVKKSYLKMGKQSILSGAIGTEWEIKRERQMTNVLHAKLRDHTDVILNPKGGK